MCERCANVFVKMLALYKDASSGVLDEFSQENSSNALCNREIRGFTMQQRRPVRRALLSVSDKAGIVEFAQHFPHAVWSCFLQVAPRAC